jgi:hypothetical protein
MHANLSPRADELTADPLRTLGLLVCLYAQLELAVRRLVDVIAGPTSPSSAAGQRVRPGLRSLTALVPARFAGEPLKLRKFRRWRNRVNKLQRRRNTLLHGAWIDEEGQLRYRRFTRVPGQPARAIHACMPPAQVALDIRFLRLDIATVNAWIRAWPYGRPVLLAVGAGVPLVSQFSPIASMARSREAERRCLASTATAGSPPLMDTSSVCRMFRLLRAVRQARRRAATAGSAGWAGAAVLPVAARAAAVGAVVTVTVVALPSGGARSV